MSDGGPRRLSPAVTLGLAGAVFSLVLLLLLIILDWSPNTESPDRDEQTIDLIPPRPLDEAEGSASGFADPNLTVGLPKGGWLQVAGPDGRVSQQYRFTHLDPAPTDLPAHWIRMAQPDVELFMAGGRLVTLQGDEADAYAPRRALEEGRLIGNVVICMYEPIDGVYADPEHSDPALTVRTASAEFDNLSGRIACDGLVDAITPTESLKGRGLTVLLNDRDNRIEQLRIESLEYLLLRDADRTALSRAGSPHPIARHARGPRPPRIIPVAASMTPAPFYRLTLQDDVRIKQAPPASQPDALPRVATADRLHVVFSLDSDAVSGPEPAVAAGAVPGTTATLIAMSIAAAPEPVDEEVLVTCKGPLTMVPIDDPARVPTDPDELQLTMEGSPVRIIDDMEGMTATCQTLTWNSTDGRFDLTAPNAEGVELTSSELVIQNTHTWVRPEHGTGGIIGGGQATFAGQAATPDSPPTTMHWSRLVDIEFEPTTSAASGEMKRLRFQGDVDVVSVDGQIEADDLELRFEPNAEGKAVPDRLISRAGIRAESDGQVLWADDLLATLAEESTTGDTSARIEIRDVQASGDVQVRLADGARAWADRLHGDAAQERVELTGADVVIMRDEVVIERGTSLVIERLQGVADWAGPGRAIMQSTPPAIDPDARVPRPATPDSRGELDSEILWKDAVHIDFDPGASSEDAAMRSIQFDGDVEIESQDGRITANRVSMQFTPGPDGRSAPHLLRCHQRVRAHSDGQTLWADDLTATLQPAESGDDDGERPHVDIDTVQATGDVQVLMKDGGRAFADQLDGDAAQELVVLTGDDVLIARQDVLIDRGRHLRINRLAGTADWTGPGRSRLLAEPLMLSANMRIPPPRIVASPGSPTVLMRTTWKTSLHYDGTFAAEAGAMDIVGQVDSVVDRSSVQRSRLQGDVVRLEFSRIDVDETETELGPTDPFGGSGRVLDRLIAKGNARLESRTWQMSERSGIPRVFYVGARHITWRDLTTEAEVIGDGDIVIREPAWAAGPASRSAPFSGPGTSRFVWSERLDLTREADDRFRMTMVGDVEGLWKSSTDSGGTATISSEEVQVLTRREDTPAPNPDGAPLRLGGDMEVDRLRAVGRVYITTPTRRADCHMLDYNTRTNIAELVARPGRSVSLVTEGATMPVHASRMIWNMDPAIDTITLEQPRGSGGR